MKHQSIRLPLTTLAVAGAFSCALGSAFGASAAVDPASAAQAINALGLDLLRQGAPGGANALLSPYSIQSALAMTFAGAAGGTRDEMAKVLHYPADEAALHQSLATLRASLEDLARRTTGQATEADRRAGRPADPVTLTIANRLFGQQGYEFRAPFLGLARDTYGAPLQLMDFARDPLACLKEINAWVETQTRQRIRDLIPPDGLDRDTRLVLVNAIYLKAPWAEAFAASATQPQPFRVRGGAAVPVPTMRQKARFGHARREGFTVVTLPYHGGELQFLILLPDQADGGAALEARLNTETLSACAQTRPTEVILHLPKFRLEPPMLRLGKALQALGMKTAFDVPPGSANFDRMAPRRPDDYLFISEAFHKTFLALDEQGTEAAAATAVVMARATAALPAREPVEVRVDRPFLFAIQHRASGACLFVGRVTDPR